MQSSTTTTTTSVDSCKTLNDLFQLVGKKNLKEQYQSEISKYKREYTKW